MSDRVDPFAARLSADAARNKVCPICGLAFRDGTQPNTMLTCGGERCQERVRQTAQKRLSSYYKERKAPALCAWCGSRYAANGGRYCLRCGPIAGRLAPRSAELCNSVRPAMGSSLGRRAMEG